MGTFVKGEIIKIEFPFSDLSNKKKRPALVIKSLPGDDLILCQITSQDNSDPNAIPITQNDMQSGSLFIDSYVRIGRLFTADQKIILGKIGHLQKKKFQQVVRNLVSLLQN